MEHISRQELQTRVFHGRWTAMVVDCQSCHPVKVVVSRTSSTLSVPSSPSLIVSLFCKASHFVITTSNSGKAANNTTASVPWTLIAAHPDKFFEPKYLPNGVKLVEISKMKSDALQSCYSHWYQRQQRGVEAFLFKHVQDSDVRIPASKRKRGPAAAADDDDDDDDDNDGGQYVNVGHLPFSPPPDETTRYVHISHVEDVLNGVHQQHKSWNATSQHLPLQGVCWERQGGSH
jgi:hypothetical protein